MTTDQLTKLLSPYRPFAAAGLDELRAAFQRQPARTALARRIDELARARRKMQLEAMRDGLLNAA